MELKLSKLSNNQYNRLSEVLGNISVAWFTAGVITPLFTRPQNLVDLIARFSVSLILFGLCLFWALKLAKGGKK